MKRLSAFTLAEVLVTLVIIGVIAAMTIPGLRKDTDSRANVTSLKKIYSEIAQAATRAMGDAGGVSTLCRTGLFDSPTTINDEFIKTYFSISKECASGDEASCFGDEPSRNEGDYTSFVLANGMVIEVQGNIPNCADNYLNTFSIYVDVNGPKKPNKGGVDRFVLELKNDGNVTAGKAYERDNLEEATANCMNEDDYNNAISCAAKIILDGWQMNY